MSRRLNNWKIVHLHSDNEEYNYIIKFSVVVDMYVRISSSVYHSSLENGVFKFREVANSLLLSNSYKGKQRVKYVYVF